MQSPAGIAFGTNCVGQETSSNCIGGYKSPLFTTNLLDFTHLDVDCDISIGVKDDSGTLIPMDGLPYGPINITEITNLIPLIAQMLSQYLSKPYDFSFKIPHNI